MNLNLDGNYKFKTEAQYDRVECAFLYSKLQENDKEFVFTGGTTSWIRLNYPENNNGQHMTNGNARIEIPEPFGVFKDENDALTNTLKPGVISRGENSQSSIPPGNVATLFYIVKTSNADPTPFINIYKVQGYSSFPNAEHIELPGMYYGFWQDDPNFPDIPIGLAPTHKPDDCPFLGGLTIPLGLYGIGFITSKIPQWKKENYRYTAPSARIESNETFYFIGGILGQTEPTDWENQENFGFFAHSRLRVYLRTDLLEEVNSGCSSVLNSDCWYVAPNNVYQAYYPILLNSTDETKPTFFAVQCDINRKGSIESFLNQIIQYWNIPGSLEFIRGVTPGGCNIDEAGNNYPPPADETVTGPFTGILKGRYSDVVLNYQKEGEIKELILPIEFPTRATYVKFKNAPNSIYDSNIPVENGWQKTEQPMVSEAFTGRVSIDKDNIYVSILYGTIREWEPNKLLPDDKSVLGTNIERTWLFYKPLNEAFIGQGSLKFGNMNYARPIKDYWKYCRNFVIDKNSFQIISDTIKTYPEPLNDVNQLIIDWTILEQQKTPRYVDFYSIWQDGEGEASLITLQNTNDCSFTGNPICYPQIAGTIRGNWLLSGNAQFFPISTVPDYIKPQTLWTQKDWIFWNLLERPKKPLNNFSFFRFELENRFGGHGRSNVNKNRFYIDLTGILQSGQTLRDYRTHENYFGEVVESERLRGSPIFDEENKVVKWIRVSQYSYPYFEPGVNRASNANFDV